MELKEPMMKYWEDIDEGVHQRLSDSMVRRCKDVIRYRKDVLSY